MIGDADNDNGTTYLQLLLVFPPLGPQARTILLGEVAGTGPTAGGQRRHVSGSETLVIELVLELLALAADASEILVEPAFGVAGLLLSLAQPAVELLARALPLVS